MLQWKALPISLLAVGVLVTMEAGTGRYQILFLFDAKSRTRHSACKAAEARIGPINLTTFPKNINTDPEGVFDRFIISAVYILLPSTNTIIRRTPELKTTKNNSAPFVAIGYNTPLNCWDHCIAIIHRYVIVIHAIVILCSASHNAERSS